MFSPVLLALLLAGCTLLFDPVESSPTLFDASIDPDGAVDANARPDARDCFGVPKLSLNIVNPDNPGGRVDVLRNAVLTGVCQSDDGTCTYCIPTGEKVTLEQTPFDGAIFDKWSTACATFCVEGTMDNSCTFLMPDQDVGCLADFQPKE